MNLLFSSKKFEILVGTTLNELLKWQTVLILEYWF